MMMKTYKEHWKKYVEELKKYSSVYGYILAILSGLAFTFGNTLVQVTIDLNPSEKIQIMQIVFFRSLVQLLLVVPIMLLKKTSVCVEKKKIYPLFFMSLAGYLGMVFMFLALDKIPLSDVLVITFTSPAFSAIFSWCILKETYKIIDAMCGLFSFIGIVIVTRPTFIFGDMNQKRIVLFQSKNLSKERADNVYIFGAFYALAGSVCLSLYFVLTRLFAKKDSALQTIFYVSLMGTIVSPIALLAIYKHFVIPNNINSATALFSVGVLTFYGVLFLTFALKFESATTVAIIRDLDVIYAFLLQYAIFKIRPTIWNITGGVIIIAATAMLTLRKVNWIKNVLNTENPAKETDDSQENLLPLQKK